MSQAAPIALAAAVFAISHAQAQELPSPTEIPDLLQSQYEQSKADFLRDVLIEAEEKQYGENGEATIVGRYTYKAGRDRYFFTAQDVKGQAGPRRTWAGGPEGIFLIKTDADRGDSIITARLPADDLRFHEICRADMGVGMQLAQFEVPLYHYLRLPDLRIEGVTRERWGGADLICVSTRRSLKGGVIERFYFDPSRDWVQHGSRRVMVKGNGDEVVSRVIYDRDGTTPLGWEYKIVRRQGGEKKLRALTITKYQKERFPDSDFRLSQFGLPEPVGHTPSAARFQGAWWWLAAAGGCAGLAILFRHLRRRSDGTVGLPHARGAT